jgi:D-alanyl-D-alanine dipeptidase
MGAGFSNCRDEWWHYSYGDAGWAVRMGLDACIYDAIDLPMEEYAEKEEVWVRLFQSRPNPFLPTPD